jgi:hypothetical protein
MELETCEERIILWGMALRGVKDRETLNIRIFVTRGLVNND